MNCFTKKIFLDQITPVAIYYKIKKLFPNEITFLFESSVNNEDGNFSYIAIGDRERITHIDGVSFFKNQNNEITKIDSNPFVFMKEYYKQFDTEGYKNLNLELGIGLIDGFIGNIGYEYVS